LILDSSIPTPREQLDAELLTTQAVSTRPDAQAAEAAVTAGKERLQLARLSWVRLLGIADATSGTLTGHELGPAFRFTLPVFNWNQGGIARAEAEVERAVRQQQTLHNQIILEVRRAHAQYLQARSELDVLKEKVRPEVETAIHQTQKAYEEGNTSYLLVLETTRQLLDSSLREAQLYADLRRPRPDAYSGEVDLPVHEIDHTLENLEEWLRPKSVRPEALADPVDLRKFIASDVEVVVFIALQSVDRAACRRRAGPQARIVCPRRQRLPVRNRQSEGDARQAQESSLFGLDHDLVLPLL